MLPQPLYFHHDLCVLHLQLVHQLPGVSADPSLPAPLPARLPLPPDQRSRRKPDIVVRAAGVGARLTCQPVGVASNQVVLVILVDMTRAIWKMENGKIRKRVI